MDNIHPKFLVQCAESIAEPLTLIFNNFLAPGVFPEKKND